MGRQRRQTPSEDTKPLSIQESTVLRLIETGIATSQAEIAVSCKLPATTVSGLFKRLQAKGKIRAAVPAGETNARSRGRPLLHYEVPRWHTVILLYLRGSSILMQGFSRGLAVTPLGRRSFLSDAKHEAVLGIIANLYVEISAAMPGGSCDYLAATTDGFLDNQGILHCHPFKPWLDRTPLRQLGSSLHSIANVPVFIMGASYPPGLLDEFRNQKDRGARSICEINIGDGVSSTFVDLDGFWGTPTRFRGDVANLIFLNDENPFGLPNPPSFEELTCGFGLKKQIEKLLVRHPGSLLARTIDLPPSECFDLLEEMHEAGADNLSTLLGERFLKFTLEALRSLNTLLEPDIILLDGYALRGRNYWKRRLASELPGQLRAPYIKPSTLDFPGFTEEDAMRSIILHTPEPTMEDFAATEVLFDKSLTVS